MSAVVEVWVGELTKLREKVLARKPFLLSKEAKAKDGSEVVEKEQQQQQQQQQQKQQHKKENISVHTDTSTMSEATVCLLMDRFVPW